jgi:hypothetical protein
MPVSHLVALKVVGLTTTIRAATVATDVVAIIAALTGLEHAITANRIGTGAIALAGPNKANTKVGTVAVLGTVLDAVTAILLALAELVATVATDVVAIIAALTRVGNAVAAASPGGRIKNTGGVVELYVV